MINHPAIAKQSIIQEIDRTGNIKRILHVFTDAECLPNSPLETSIAKAIVAYLEAHTDVDSARIN